MCARVRRDAHVTGADPHQLKSGGYFGPDPNARSGTSARGCFTLLRGRRGSRAVPVERVRLGTETVTEEHFHKIFNINVLGLILTTQAAAKHLGEGGSIINIGSGASRLTPPQSTVYTGTKGAVDAITGVLARELGPRGIRVNSINPGPVKTEGTDSAGLTDSDFVQGFVAQTPLGRIGQVGDIAPIAVFLASDESAWLTGEVILATGGLR